jgi:RNA polymerase sigma-70 factor, ECF subfamily
MNLRRDMDGDDSLWRRSSTGDTEAFAALFERHAKAIYNYCFRRVGDWSVAEDLLSIVFLEAWKLRAREVQPGKVLPWLYGIATNVVRNQRRSERRYTAALRRVPKPGPEADFSPDADERIDDEARMRTTLALLSGLPRRELDVLVLCAWCELSYEDASIALGIPIGTVRSRLSRARRRLRELGLAGGHIEGATPSDEESS